MKRWGFHGMPTCTELQSLTEESVALEVAGQSPEYGLVRRCLEMLEANTNGLVDCEFGGLTMMSLSSTSLALGYLARLETHCKCVTQGYLDTGGRDWPKMEGERSMAP